MIETVLVLIGILFFILSIMNYRKIFSKVPDPELLCKWKIIYYLTLFFLIGYLYRLYELLLVFPATLNIMIGMVYCFGAIYVYTVTFMGHRTISLVKTWKKK